MVWPDEAGIGATPARRANAVSFAMRPGVTGEPIELRRADSAGLVEELWGGW